VTTVAFTGSRDVPPACIDAIEEFIDRISADLFVTGACVGVDQMIATLISARRPMAKQRIVVPRDRSRVDRYWLSAIATNRNVEVVSMDRGSTYRDRNLVLLGELVLGLPTTVNPIKPDLLVGLPMFAEDDSRSLRSGTWQTIRLAQEPTRNIPTQVYVLADLALIR